ncbi:MAG: endolytic transglycosylase MltG, partial [Acidimicrobiia bacterium]
MPAAGSPRRRRRGRALRFAALGLALAVLLVASGGLWVRSQLDPSGPPGAAVRVEIPEGSSTARIAELLADAGVVADARVFRFYLRFRGADGFQAGSYELRRRSSVSQALEGLNGGPSLPPAFNLTVPEGLTVAEVAERVGRVEHLDPATFLAAATDGSVRSVFEPEGSANLEGLLFPETYRIDDDEDERAVLERMVATFEQVAGEVGLADAPRRVGVSPYEAVIVASLVEAEAKSDVVRPKSARGFYNRLARKMPLG